MPTPEKSYFFNSNERGLFVEIYFPKKVVYQGPIFEILKMGQNEEGVKDALKKSAGALLVQLGNYQHLLDPYRYEDTEREKTKTPLTLEEAHQRIDMYASHFKGWSMYEVDGVWLSNGGIDEERTHIIRIMFRLPSAYTQEAISAGCFDVLRSIIFWCVSSQGNLDEHRIWEKDEQTSFIARHKHLKKNKDKMAFAKKYFVPVAKEVAKWQDDCDLFLLGYFVKQFSLSALSAEKEEKEIWVTSFFNLTINVVKQVSP